MAVKTPDPILRENTGSSTLHIATFSDIDDTDTWASGLTNIIGYWAVASDEATSGQLAGIDVAESSGTFTFSVGEANRTALLYVLTKS